MAAERPHLEVEDRGALRAWLAEHHASSDGVWLVRHRKGHDRHIPWDDVVEEVLCVGWIDSQARPLDQDRTLLLLTPRRARSRWSKINKGRVAHLEAAGLLLPAGIAEIEAAKADGRWTALDDVEALIEPDDLVVALAEVPAARAAWDGFPPSARKAILDWISQAKRPETRDKRVAETVAEAAEGRRANQWRPKPR